MQNSLHLPLTAALASVLSLTAFSAPTQAFTVLKSQEFLENIGIGKSLYANGDEVFIHLINEPYDPNPAPSPTNLCENKSAWIQFIERAYSCDQIPEELQLSPQMAQEATLMNSGNAELFMYGVFPFPTPMFAGGFVSPGFTPGEELIFALQTSSEEVGPIIYSTGDPNANASLFPGYDNPFRDQIQTGLDSFLSVPHARVRYEAPGIARVGFEDVFYRGELNPDCNNPLEPCPQADWDFNDYEFLISGVDIQPEEPVLQQTGLELIVEEGEVFDFQAMDYGTIVPDKLKFQWDFNDDGETDYEGFEGEMQWSFGNPGVYDSQLTVIDDSDPDDIIEWNYTFQTTVKGEPVAPQFSVLWWDTTIWHRGMLRDEIREEIPTFLDNFGGGDIFDTTYISHKTSGGLEAHLASNSYDVVVLDTLFYSTSPFNSADREALKQHYTQKSNLMLDGSLTIRSFEYRPETDFPGHNNALGNFTVNQVYELATRGGGIFIGTDHNFGQHDANYMLDGLFPGRTTRFSGITNPSTDGVFYGADLLNNQVEVAPNDIFNHWSAVPSQGVAPTGDFIDFLGNPVTLYSQVDVANKPGGGQKYSYISTSWKPDVCATAVTDTSSACKKVPEPSVILGLLAVGAVGSLLKRH